ncbi:hypothetical protein Godav_024080 [Gossypium davidsonii]|uniref:Uncharacterized protein n=4 Tax=Gossypium TaxID=3633 RepID=A0A7J8STX3_GOSDV|nr:hypothetical protein [Gossypium davidsonii]MBA0665212.1 hypothetical protein [Gossypium klotzschianum]
MKKRFLDKVKDNLAVRIWSKKTQQEKGDSLMEGYMLELWDFTHISKSTQLYSVAQGSKLTKFILKFQHLDFLKKATEHNRDERAMDTKKRVNIFALSIYRLVILTKVLGHIDDTVLELFDWFDKRVTPVLTILVETFRSLSVYRRAVSYRVFSENYSPLKEFVATPRIWGAIGYAPLLVLRQYRSRKFIPATPGLAQFEFAYKGDNYKKKVREISNAWNQTHKMKRFVANLITTPEYYWWWGKRINDNVPSSS